MLKKNSWIVALILALTLTALFTGCIEALVDAEAGMTYTEVELGDFNVWGGQNYQRGWAVGGLKFLGVGDKSETAADKGYKNEDFAKATKLVIEMEDASHPAGNLDIIWGAADDKGNSVGKDWIQTGAIKSSKDGNILTVDLTAMKDYASYKGGNYAMRKIVLQAGGEKAGLPFVKKAKLLIPDKVDFIPVTGMQIVKDNFSYTLELKLEGLFTPEDATNQIVNWSIKSWTDGTTTYAPVYPSGNSTSNPNWATELAAYNTAKTNLLGKVKFKDKTITIRPAETQEDTEVWDYSVLPPVKVIIPSDGAADIPAQTALWHEDDVIVATDGAASMGTVIVTATVKNGLKESGDGADFVKDFSITIKDVVPFKFKLNGVEKTTIIYGAVDNSGNGPSSMIVPEGGNGYTFDMGGGYGNSYYYIELDAGAGNTFASYTAIDLKYKGISGDFNYKNLRIMAMATIPPSTYNPGSQISQTGGTGDVSSTAASLTGTFGNDDTSVDSAFTTNWNTLKTNQVIYIWIIPWGNGGTVFEITDINIR